MIDARKIFQQTEAECSSRVDGFRMTPINNAVLIDWRDQWPESLKLPVRFDWPEIMQYTLNDSEFPHQYLGFAFYANRELCGLASGYLEAPHLRQSAVVIEHLEGNPGPYHPMKGMVLSCILAATEIAATVNLNDFVRVLSPAEPTRRFYPSLGYSLRTHEYHGLICEKAIL